MIKRLCKPLAAFFIVVMAIAIASPLMLQMVQAADNADTTKVLSCEVDADVIVHKHDENCYDESGNLICPLAEVDAHTHTKDCYPAASSEETAEQSTEVTDETPSAEETDSSVSPAPTCGQEEIILHSHDNSCYDASGALTCGLPVVVAHQHTSDCFTTQEVVEEDTAGKAETKTNAQVVTEDGKDDDGDDDKDEINLEIDGDALAQDAMGTATTAVDHSDHYVGFTENKYASYVLETGIGGPFIDLMNYSEFLSNYKYGDDRTADAEIAYCFNYTAHAPDSREWGGFNVSGKNAAAGLANNNDSNDYTYFNVYEKLENASNTEFNQLATNTNDTALAEEGIDLRTKVLSIALNGYPHDYSSIQKNSGLGNEDFRILTQFAIWHFTDSQEYQFSNAVYQEVYDALIASNETDVLDQVSFINLYKDIGVTDGENDYEVGSSEFYADNKGYQNLLNVGRASDALPDQHRQVTVSKTVTAETNSTTPFDFTITLTRADKESADGKYAATLYSSSTDTTGSSQEIEVVNGTANFQLSHDQRLTIDLGGKDVSYTITETKAAGYTQSVTSSAGATTTKTESSLSVTKAHAGTKDTVDFTNSKTGVFTLKKEVVGDHDPDDKYYFQVAFFLTSLNGGFYTGTLETSIGTLDFKDQAVVVSLKDGESIEFYGLPTGVLGDTDQYGYSIAEFKGVGYNSSYYTDDTKYTEQLNDKGIIGGVGSSGLDDQKLQWGAYYMCKESYVYSTDVLVTCTNYANEDAYYAQYKNLTLSKEVKDHSGTKITPSGSFRFDLILNDASGEAISDSYTAIVTNTETNSTSTKTVKFTNGKAAVYLKAGQSMTIEALPSGSTYTIKEEDTDQYTTTVETTGENTGARDPDTGVSTSGTLDDNLTVKYTNQVSYGKLKITKTLLDKDDNENGDWLKEFTFDVTLVYKDSGAPYADQVVYLEQGGTTTEQRTDAVTGKLTVKASVSSPATLLFTDDVTYTVEEDLTNSIYNNYALYSSTNTRNTVTVGGTKTTAFTNKYYGTYSGVYVAKVWNDNNDTSDRKTVYVQIYKNGTEKIKDEFSPTASTNFRNSGAWTNGYTLTLNSYEKGEKVIYSVVEKSMAGYTTSYSDMEVDANGFVKLTVTNTKKAAVPTGINITWLPFAVVGVLAAGGLGVLIWYNHKKKVE
jgi:TQXA domain-containing protein